MTEVKQQVLNEHEHEMNKGNITSLKNNKQLMTKVSQLKPVSTQTAYRLL